MQLKKTLLELYQLDVFNGPVPIETDCLACPFHASSSNQRIGAISRYGFVESNEQNGRVLPFLLPFYDIRINIYIYIWHIISLVVIVVWVSIVIPEYWQFK
jgi:hypothetical protein